MLSIIGCGNTNRADDGAGVYVAGQLQHHLEAHPQDSVRVFDAGTAGMDVMFQARGSTRLIIIDASNTGSEPGEIYKVPGSELENRPQPSYSLHDFRWDHALYAGRRIYGDDFPTDISVYLIEAASLDLGIGLSPPVQTAADRVVEHIIKEIQTHANTT